MAVFIAIEKLGDELAATVNIPLIATLALFWEKVGIVRDEALTILRESPTVEGMTRDESAASEFDRLVVISLISTRKSEPAAAIVEDSFDHYR